MAVNRQNSFANALRALREAIPLTQEELAKRAGLSPQAIKKYEGGGTKTPRAYAVRALANALELEGEKRREFIALSRGSEPPNIVDAPILSNTPSPSPDDNPLSDPPTLPFHHVFVDHAASNGTADPTLVQRETPPPNHLPAPLVRFIGRQKDRATIGDLLRAGHSVAIVGLRGMGKSILAIQAAWDLARDANSPFPGGIVWVPCETQRGLAGLGWVYAQVLRAWNVRPRMVEMPMRNVEECEDTLCRVLLPDVPTLILLDNMEVDFPAARAMDTLSACGARLLITAYHDALPLRVRLHPLKPLSEAEALDLLAECAVGSGGTWEATQDADAGAEVVKTIEYLPLAIELAAARAIRTKMGIGGIAKDLRRRHLLERIDTSRSPDGGMQRRLEETLQELSEPLRVQFSSLGLPAGIDWPRPVVEALFEGIAPLEVSASTRSSQALETLSGFSLLSFIPAHDEEGETRVHMHSLVRDLAREKWARQPPSVQMAALIGLTKGVLAWRERTSTTQSPAGFLYERDGPLIAGVVHQALVQRGELTQGLPRGDGTTQVVDRASLDEMETLIWQLCELDETLVYLERGLATARETQEPLEVLAALHRLGTIRHMHADFTRARAYYYEALSLAEQHGQDGAEATLLTDLGDVAVSRVQVKEPGVPPLDADDVTLLDEADNWLDRAETTARAIGDVNLVCTICIWRARTARLRGKDHWARAVDLLDQAREANKHIGSRHREAECLATAARLYRDQGKTAQALATYQEAIEAFSAVNRAWDYDARTLQAELAALDDR